MPSPPPSRSTTSRRRRSLGAKPRPPFSRPPAPSPCNAASASGNLAPLPSRKEVADAEVCNSIRKLGLLPPPLAGEGWGGGALHGLSLCLPPPYPSPASGGGDRPSARRNDASTTNEETLDGESLGRPCAA